MPSGIVVQHGHVAAEYSGVVRCDVTAIITFFEAGKWPPEMKKGGFIDVSVKREADFRVHESSKYFDQVTRTAVRNYFQNGGIELHVFGVCIENQTDLFTPIGLEEVLGELWDHLRAEEEIALIYVPIAGYLATEVTKKGRIFSDCEALYSFFLRHCKEMNNRFLIMDVPRRLQDDFLLNWVRQFRNRNLTADSYGALYYPWLWNGDDVSPPGATVAGMYVRVEKSHPPLGIQWPPANVILYGVTHLDMELPWEYSREYLEAGINPIVLQGARGIVVFGARTLSLDPVLRFINSRRILNLVVEQVRKDTEWAVFEINNPHLWSVLSRDINYRLNTFWNAGLLTMSKDGSKYQVICSKENNPKHLLDSGQVNIGIRLQPVGASEQIHIDLNLGR
ncbi:MAG: phage tail sheath C-terminal domain-containing protein [Myxococcota bacterium]|nr:phage tail sheath C-terminal domain-containing protein [Myxococcota bacterium]